MATPAYLASENLKIEQVRMGKDISASRYDPLRVIDEIGGRPLEGVQLGGVKFGLKTRVTATAGFRNDATAQTLAHLGVRDLLGVENIAITPSYLVSRAQTIMPPVADFEAGGHAAQYFDPTAEAVMEAQTALEEFSGRLFATGIGPKAIISSTASAIASGAAGPFSINQLRYVSTNDVFQVWRTNAFVSDVLLRVDKIDVVVGSGTMTVTNDGGTSYTPTEDDELFFAYEVADGGSAVEAAQNFFQGIDNDINTNTYPATGANNVTLDDPAFRSIVKSAASSAVGTYGMLWALRQEVLSRMSKDNMDAAGRAPGRYLSNSAIKTWAFMASNDILGAIMQEHSTKRRDVGNVEVAEPGWGTALEIDGMLFVGNDYIPPNTIYLINATGFSRGKTAMQPIGGSVFGSWEPMTGSDKIETRWFRLDCVLCTDRRAQGKITGVTGLTAASVGLN